MAKFMDVHDGFFGVSAQQLQDAHNAWTWPSRTTRASTTRRPGMDRESGKVFCLATGPIQAQAVMRIHERAGHPTSNV